MRSVKTQLIISCQVEDSEPIDCIKMYECDWKPEFYILEMQENNK